jgi:hypothetical protein
MMQFGKVALLLASIGLSQMALAQGATVSSPVDLARQAASLKPGQWVWAPQISPSGPVTIFVDLSRQIATVYRNGVRIGVSTISSGMPGHDTPTGVFVILQKDPNHHSSTYNDAPMPFQERLTWGGVALHAGGLPGYPESHGCVHLPLEFSKLLFGITQLGETVVIAGQPDEPALIPSAGVLDPDNPGGSNASYEALPAGQPSVWTPDVSPSGPVTIVISKSNQQMVVLRNGKEIGRAAVKLPDTNFQTHVLTLTRTAAGATRWVMAGVPGGVDAGMPIDSSVIAQLKLPPGFAAQVKSVIQPGTTVLVTQAPLSSDTTGKSQMVLASN